MPVRKKYRRTKIVCTMGPACAGEELPRLLKAGMNVARLNFSHGDRQEHAAWIKRLRELSRSRGTPLAILQDLAGPKIRIGQLPGGAITLLPGEDFTISTVPPPPTAKGAQVDFPEVVADTPVGALLRLADGLIELQVAAKTPQALQCRVLAGGVLRSQVGINFPQHSLSVPAFTAKDREDLRFGVEMGVDFIALSYVRSPQDLEEARQMLAALGAEIPLIAKIEKHEALTHLNAIVAAADGLMVARGDLGVEVPLERVPFIQKEVIAAANRAGKPVITATQMLLSMVDHSRPSRAEATDVANAILDGTDAVMLSEETAAGHYPVAAVRFLDRVSRATEENFPYASWLRARAPARRLEIAAAVSFAACELALDLRAAAILTSTDFGGTPRLISRLRPRAPIIAVTPRLETWRRLSLSWGVFPLLAPPITHTDERLRVVVEEAGKAKFLKAGDRVVITAGTPAGARGATNLVKVDVIT